jgi:hypothetical protein
MTHNPLEKIIHLIIVITGIGSIAAFIYLAHRHGWVRPFVFTAPLLVGIFLIWAGLRWSPAAKGNLVLAGISCFVAVSILDQLLNFTDFGQTKPLSRAEKIKTTAEKLGHEYDNRSSFEVIRDFRKRGINAYTNIYTLGSNPVASTPKNQRGKSISRKKLLPLGGISNAKTVMCNENGSYSIYTSDEHGFNNPSGLWKQNPDIVLLGDSFGQGACVQRGEESASIIRKSYPRTLNVSYSNTGALMMLARLKEYVLPLKPKVVIWQFYEGNDLADTWNEFRSSTLKRYYHESYGQGLRKSQPQLDDFLKKFFDRKYQLQKTKIKAAPKQEPNQEKSFLSSIRTLSIAALRRLIVIQRAKEPIHKYMASTLREDEWKQLLLYNNVLTAAHRATLQAGSKFLLVYVPDSISFADRFATMPVGLQARDHFSLRKQILAAAARENIPTVDLFTDFLNRDDVTDLYAFEGGHFSAKGYRLAANKILHKLKEKKYLGSPTSSNAAGSSPSVK